MSKSKDFVSAADAETASSSSREEIIKGVEMPARSKKR
jgi:hypothetical protein